MTQPTSIFHDKPSCALSRLKARRGCMIIRQRKATAFPVPSLALPRRKHQGGRRGCVLRSRQTVLREPTGIDAWLPFSGKLVSLATRWDELNTNVQASGQSTQRGPHVRFCERCRHVQTCWRRSRTILNEV
jgi:hypothetical protein